MAGQNSKAFSLRREGDSIVIAKWTENLVEGIVNGIIVDLLAFSLLSVSFIVGIWVLMVSVTQKHPVSVQPLLVSAHPVITG